LNSNTLYHYRCIGHNEVGVTYGEDQIFTTLFPPPSGAGVINGPESVCLVSSDHIYTIDPIDFAEDYIWTLPTGAVITDGENTESITVSFNDSAESGNISVYGSGEGGSGPPSELFITVNPRPVPFIYGADTACFTSIYTYSTEAGMNGYEWTISQCGEIVDGDGASAITVQWSSEGTQSVSVTYTSPSMVAMWFVKITAFISIQHKWDTVGTIGKSFRAAPSFPARDRTRLKSTGIMVVIILSRLTMQMLPVVLQRNQLLLKCLYYRCRKMQGQLQVRISNVRIHTK